MHPDRGWLVFFDEHSADLTPRMMLIVKELAEAFIAEHGQEMLLDGHTDSMEASPEDHDLGLRRAQAVAEGLQQAGVPRTKIYTKDFGSTSQIAHEPPGAAAPDNRRVEFQPIGLWREDRRQVCGP